MRVRAPSVGCSAIVTFLLNVEKVAVEWHAMRVSLALARASCCATFQRGVGVRAVAVMGVGTVPPAPEFLPHGLVLFDGRVIQRG